MGSHSVTCHPAEVTFPPLPQPKLALDQETPKGCKAELTLDSNLRVCVRTRTYSVGRRWRGRGWRSRRPRGEAAGWLRPRWAGPWPHGVQTAATDSIVDTTTTWGRAGRRPRWNWTTPPPPLSQNSPETRPRLPQHIRPRRSSTSRKLHSIANRSVGPPYSRAKFTRPACRSAAASIDICCRRPTSVANPPAAVADAVDGRDRQTDRQAGGHLTVLRRLPPAGSVNNNLNDVCERSSDSSIDWNIIENYLWLSHIALD